MRSWSGLGAAIALVGALSVRPAMGVNKNGVSPQVISLPSGPGSIQGLGESFQPQLNSGSGSLSIPIQLPSGPGGFAPMLSLQYHTGQGNGCIGIGWTLTAAAMVSRNMDRGLPLYVDAPNGVDDDMDGSVDNPQEIDRFSGTNLEELVPLSDGAFRSESESMFVRYHRVGPGWHAREKNGMLHEFGMGGSSRIENGARVFGWLRERTSDLNGNSVEYRYVTDSGSPGQKYLREMRWARSEAYYAVVFTYDPKRPDVYSDFRSGFEVRTGMRLTRIEVIAQGIPPATGALRGDFNEDGQPDSLIRRYNLQYEPQAALSRLQGVTLLGSDGVTSLPSMRFGYTDWVPPDNVSATITRSTGDPAAALDSDNVELIDMNRDGLPDLLQATQASHRIYLNLGLNDAGRLAWDTVGTLVGNAPGLNLGSTAVHLADHSADGEADLVHKVNDSTFRCYLNSGVRSWLSPVALSNTDSWPRWPFENLGSRTLDTDHNRLSDILFTGDNSVRLWMLLPGGRYGREVSLPVLSDGTQAFRFEEPGARIADVNGDRISDLVWVQSTRVVYWASCGRGNFEGPLFLPLSSALSAAEITRTDFADINGDALADLVVVRPAASPNGIHYRINRGLAGFDSRRTIQGLPAVQLGDTSRCADLNGNGSVDLLISNSARPAGAREQFLDFVPGVRPNLLTRIENGLGLVTSLEFESSVDQMVRARTAGTPWKSAMPISIPVVARMTEDDSRGNQYTREFTYRNPYFDPEKQEFRGFSETEVREIGDVSAPTKVTVHTFDTGSLAACRKGKLLSQEVRDTGGSRFDRQENSISHRLLEKGSDGREVCFAFNEASDVYVFENTANAVHIRTEFEYDDYGNILREDRQGIVPLEGDDVFLEKAYIYRPAIWLMDRVSRTTTRDGKGVRAADDLFGYDERGNLLEHHRWLDTEKRNVVALRNEYDAFGNVIRMMDANHHSRSVEFDELLHTYPLAEIIHLDSRDLGTTATYNMGFGTVESAIDFAGAITTFEYDPLSRPTTILRTGGAETRYVYELGAPISHVITKVKEDVGGGTFDSYAYFDGFGRGLGSKVESKDGKWRFLDAVTFNKRKLEILRWLPYYSDTNEYETPDAKLSFQSTAYDVQGRAIRRTNPDATQSQVVYEPLVLHVFDEVDTAGSTTPTTHRKDGLDRLVEVVERNGPEELRTRYAWSPLGDLIEIVDAQSNIKSMVYDSLRRNIRLNDPDRGSIHYTHDDVGNVIRTTDAKGQSIEYSYDFANRLTSENYLDNGGGSEDPIDVRWVYDLPTQDLNFGDGQSASATFTGGRLASVADLSGEEHHSYDARGNVLWTVKRIRDPLTGFLTPYMTGFGYDIMDRLIEVQYPDNDRCRYSYDSGSLLQTISGGPGGQAIISNTDYEPTGQPSRLSYGNGVITTYTYDNRDRLAGLRSVSPVAGDLINYNYYYDPVSNITRVEDNRPHAGPHGIALDSPRRNTQLFVYDDLYRLTQVRFSPLGNGLPDLGQVDYSFDKIGNMVSQTCPPVNQPGHITDAKASPGAMTIGGNAGSQNRTGRLPGQPPGPHALTNNASGGAYDYDSNGNLIGLDGAALAWDFQGRLVRFRKNEIDAHYAYDHAGRRVSKLVTQGKNTDQTLYVNQYFEYRPNRAPLKYVFNGATRVSQVKGALDPSRPRLQRIWLGAGWNPVSIAVDTKQTIGGLFGEGEVYEWTGTQYRLVPSIAPAPVGIPLWVHVNQARVATAFGIYAPLNHAIDLPTGQDFYAWPMLEPFVSAVHLSSNETRIHVLEPFQNRWLMSDPTLPSFLTDVLDSFPAGTALWMNPATPSMFLPQATENRDFAFYHGDQLGSAHGITDRQGMLLVESQYYPFGHLRHVHQPGIPFQEHYGFTQKERDWESDLHYFEARYLASGLGRFISPDPKFANPGLLSPEDLSKHLSQPQDLNLYAYARNNPIANLDPDGRELFAIGRTLDDPAAAQQIQRDFVSLLGRLADLDLQVSENGRITENPDGLMNPYPASPTLQASVRELISSKKTVIMNVRNSHGRVLGAGGGWDTFFENPGHNRAGTVWLKDWQEVAGTSPNFARIAAAHVLREYQWRGAGFAFAHQRALEREAVVADELIGHRPHEEVYERQVPGGVQFDYGAKNWYIWNSDTNAVQTGPAVTEVPLPP